MSLTIAALTLHITALLISQILATTTAIAAITFHFSLIVSNYQRQEDWVTSVTNAFLADDPTV